LLHNGAETSVVMLPKDRTMRVEVKTWLCIAARKGISVTRDALAINKGHSSIVFS
jgi:hypothetical protein